MAEKDDKSKSTTADIATAMISAPDIDIDGGELTVGRKAIADGKQAWSIFTNIRDDQSKRNETNAKILKKYSGEQPRNQMELINLNQDWRSNFPTMFLKGIIDRAIPNFVAAIDQMTQLTQAKLPYSVDGVEIYDCGEKTRKFRDLFTKYVRTKWKKHRGYNDKLAHELCIIGYGFSVHSDEDNPWPVFYDQSRARTYERSSQDSADWQVFCFDEDLLIHQVVDLIEDLKVAKEAGWQLENCVKALNQSYPLSPDEDTFSNPRSWVEMLQDLGTGASFTRSARGVEFGHVVAVEPKAKEGEGRITHYALDRRTGETLFARERQFEKMEDVVTAFTLEEADDHVYGPQGLGRILVNISIAVDELVNDAVSQLKMNGLMVIKTASQSALQAQMMVRAPFIVLKSDGEPLNKEQFPFDIDAFLGVYGQLQKLAEIAAGQYIANVTTTEDSVQSAGGRRTAREATIDYTRELQSKAAGISRFSGQYLMYCMQPVQERLTKKDSSHEDAKAFQKDLKELGLSPKEIELLGKCPTVQDVKDASGLEAQKKTQAAQGLVGNQFYDQKKVWSTIVSGQVNQSFNDELMLPDGMDPNVKGAQMRLSLFENDAIFDGTDNSINVVPNDDDITHFTGHIPEGQKRLSKLLSQHPLEVDPAEMDDMNAFIMHGVAHINQAKSKKLDKATVKKAEQTYEAFDKVLTTLMKAKQQAQEEAMKHVADQHAIQANQFMQEQAGAMASPELAAQFGAGGEEGQPDDMGPAQPAGQDSEMNEKTLIAWIGKYDLIPDEAKQKLLTVGGLGPVTDPTVTPIPKAKPQDPVNEDIGMPELPEPMPSPMMAGGETGVQNQTPSAVPPADNPSLGYQPGEPMVE